MRARLSDWRTNVFWPRSSSPFGATALVASAVFVLGACTPDLGECPSGTSDPVAYEIVYFRGRPDLRGLPMYAGQALVQTSCGNGVSCHAEGLEPEDRHGAPAGLDFDLSLACLLDRRCDDLDAQLARLARSQARLVSHAELVLRALRRGAMPPSGGAPTDETGIYVRVPPSPPGVTPNPATAVEEGEPLPSIDTAAGRAIVRRWLACGAPVVKATTPLGDPGLACVNAGQLECVVRFPQGEPPDPTWSSIYEVLILPSCGIRCHAPGPESQLEESELHLESEDRAYEDLLGTDGMGRVSTGEDCAMEGWRLVTPGDPDASLLIEKLTTETPVCGDPMPPEGAIPAEFLEPVRQWILNGAPND